MSTVANSPDTAARLLAAASEVFAEVGYRDTTLRDICKRAGANNAAVNYHFGDKEHLYLAVIEHAISSMQAHLPRSGDDRSGTPEERLHRFVHTLLTKLLGEGPPTWLMKLMAQELAEPTAGLDRLVEKVIAPIDADLGSIIRELAAPYVTKLQLLDCVRSIIAQCHQYHHARSVVFRIGPYTSFDAATIDHLADHITRFSLGGIRSM